MASDIRAYRYVTDQGAVFQMGLAQYIAAQQNAGGDPLVGSAPVAPGQVLETMPKSLKPRRVTLVNAAGRKRSIPVFSTDAPLWTGTSTQINLQDGAGASTAYSVYSRSGERRRQRAPGV